MTLRGVIGTIATPARSYPPPLTSSPLSEVSVSSISRRSLPLSPEGAIRVVQIASVVAALSKLYVKTPVEESVLIKAILDEDERRGGSIAR